MTSLLEGAKKLVTRSSDTGARVEGLERAAEAARGRVDDAIVDDATAVAARASSRLKLSAEHTVVALGGATGSGKSSTFNALSGLELSAVGVRRPTTSWATAVVWGKQGAEELLEWLGIPARHQVTRDSMLSKADEDVEMRGVVLLDLPDHDSTEVSHHLEVERLVQLADMMVWVLDPQKYADAAIHDRFLKPLAGHKDVMLVVLNHIDTVPEDRRAGMVDDVRRLLEADGLGGVPVLPVSARQGWGVQELRALIAKRVAEKKVTRSRLEADVRAAAQRLEAATGTGKVPTLSKERVAALDDAFADAAGVPTVVKAVADSTRLRANRATGWPVTAWFSRLKPDPLKRLHLDLGAAGKELTGAARTSVPQATGVQRARVDTEVRALADQVGEGMAPSWAERGPRGLGVPAARPRRPPRPRRRRHRPRCRRRSPCGPASCASCSTSSSSPRSSVPAGSRSSPSAPTPGCPSRRRPRCGGFPLPTLLLLGGIGLGLLLALVCRWLVALTARSRARAADKRLRDAISEVSAEMVVEPIQAELASYAAVREGLATALR